MHLSKTELGQTALKERSALLSARQRSAFILVDGKRTLEELLTMGVAQGDLDYLIDLGFLAGAGGVAAGKAPTPAALPQSASASAIPASYAAGRSEQQRYFDAKPIATQLSASLGLRGFMLNLAVEGAAGYADLVKLLPKLQSALGADACRTLERALLE
jgi:hypothetical protein